MIRDVLTKILAGEDLTTEEASALMDLIMTGGATPAQIGGVVIGLRHKGEHPQEVAGFVSAMRRHSVRVDIDDPDAVDGCGTGGDGAQTFNISTAAAIVAAACGVTVAKHGNRSISSRCGSADLLEASGGRIDPGADRVRDCINALGFGFMFAPSFHPAMRHASGPRKELGIRTVFNILGPMTNPAGVRRQLVGVYDRRLMRLVAEVLALTGSLHVIVAHSRDGLDEFSISAPTDYIEMRGGQFVECALEPEQMDIARHPEGHLAGGDAAFNVAILRRVLDGRADGYGDAVALNAGAMIYVAGKAGSIREGTVLARAAIRDGRAKAKFDEWVAYTRA